MNAVTALQVNRPEAALGSTQQGGGADQDEDDLCVVCWDRPKEAIFLSCGHMVRPDHSLAALSLLLHLFRKVPALKFCWRVCAF